MNHFDRYALQRAHSLFTYMEHNTVVPIKAFSSFLSISQKDAIQHAEREGIPLYIGYQAATKFVQEDYSEMSMETFPINPEEEDR